MLFEDLETDRVLSSNTVEVESEIEDDMDIVGSVELHDIQEI